MNINHQVLWLWIKESLNFNNKKTLQLIDTLGGVEEVYQAEDFAGCPFLTPEETKMLMKKDLRSAWEVYGECNENCIGIFTLDDRLYPQSLREIDNPPSPLFYKGHLISALEKPSITIAGTRKNNGYGEKMTKEITTALSLCGFTIVCGVADGIDSIAYEAALQADGRIILVLPFGLLSNSGWKTRHFNDVLTRGALVSENYPRKASHRFSYHERNRILSGISDATLIPQAPEKSGAIMTANYAIEQNKDLYAVMANSGMEESAGSNQLIKDGCYPVTDFNDILQHFLPQYEEELNHVSCKQEKVLSLQEELQMEKLDEFKKKHLKKLNDDEQKIFKIMDLEEKSADTIIEQAGLPISETLQILTTLEYKRLIVSCPGGKFKVIL